MVTCDVCKGNGETDHWGPCDTCKGHGVLTCDCGQCDAGYKGEREMAVRINGYWDYDSTAIVCENAKALTPEQAAAYNAEYFGPPPSVERAA